GAGPHARVVSRPGLAAGRPARGRRHLRRRGDRHPAAGWAGRGLPASGHGLALADVLGQHRGLLPAGLLRDPPPGAAAAVELPPATAGHGAVRRAVHVLHDAGGDPEDDRRARLGPGRGVHGDQRRRRLRRDLPGHRDGPQSAGAPVSLLLWAGVVLIGGTGSVVSFLADGLVAASAGRGFPYGTFVVNVSGAAILGLLSGLALGPDQALLAGTAAVGSYTTFSTWMLETQRLGEGRPYRRGAGDGSVTPGL